jgi:Zn-dependent protease with chaperone function
MGRLRDSLTAVSQRVGFRCNDILVWNTRNSMANALVTGILPWARYIVLTDRLVRELSTEEVQAVLGHEIGHVKHHHMSFYMVFLLGSLLTMGCLWQVCENLLLAGMQPDGVFRNQLTLVRDWLPNWEVFAAIPPMLVGAVYIYFVFGYLSRFCERQADIFGCRTVSCQVFVNALEKVAVLNGIDRERPGWLSCWLHPPIAQRVDFLQRMAEDSGLEPRFQRRVGLMKWSMSLALGVVLGASLWFGVKPASTESAKAATPRAAGVR